jgi:hypothetical protein
MVITAVDMSVMLLAMVAVRAANITCRDKDPSRSRDAVDACTLALVDDGCQCCVDHLILSVICET